MSPPPALPHSAKRNPLLAFPRCGLPGDVRLCKDHASIVDHHVESAEAVDRDVEEAFDIGSLADVALTARASPSEARMAATTSSAARALLA